MTVRLTLTYGMNYVCDLFDLVDLRLALSQASRFNISRFKIQDSRFQDPGVGGRRALRDWCVDMAKKHSLEGKPTWLVKD